MRVILSLAMVALVSGVASSAASADPPPHPLRGLYAIWANPKLLDLPFVEGGQVMVQWQDLEPAEGQYDFSRLDAKLKSLHARNKPATVQVNGNRKPTYLFAKVPYCRQRISAQVSDQRGALQYWHPAHMRAYINFLAAYGKHLKESPYRASILGVRLNFNGLGTEHLWIKKDQRDLRMWIVPPGVAPGPYWTPALAEAYKLAVIKAFMKNFRPEIRVFVRNNISRDLDDDRGLAEQFKTGKLCLFHTSSEVQPRSKGVERQYLMFLKYCRPGKTLGYAESWTDAGGRHGDKLDRRWCSPCQWNYWRVLVDLNCGVSFIGCYGSDLARAGDPEFRAAFQFAAKYAGCHASPSVAPGAWVALREGDYLKGDYTFLMQRFSGDASVAFKNAGPADQRYGAWARKLPPGKTMRFALNDAFAQSLAGKRATVRIVWLPTKDTVWQVACSGRTFTAPPSASGRWQVTEFVLPQAAFSRDSHGAHLTLVAKTDVILHMVGIERRSEERTRNANHTVLTPLQVTGGDRSHCLKQGPPEP